MAFGASVLAAIYLIVRISMTGGGAVTAVSLDAGAGPLSARDISTAINISGGRSLHSADTDRIFSEISGIPAVRFVSVRKIPSGKLAIAVRQREVVAVWTDGAKFYPLAADGRRLDNAIADAPAGTLVFSGKLPDDISAVVRTVKGIPGLSGFLRRVEWTDGRRWNLYTNSGIKIMLPESDMAAALKRLVILHNQNRILDRGISVLDMRDMERTLVKIKN